MNSKPIRTHNIWCYHLRTTHAPFSVVDIFHILLSGIRSTQMDNFHVSINRFPGSLSKPLRLLRWAQMLELTSMQTPINIFNHEIVNKNPLCVQRGTQKTWLEVRKRTMTQYLQMTLHWSDGANKTIFSPIAAALKKKISLDGLQWNSYVYLCSWWKQMISQPGFTSDLHISHSISVQKYHSSPSDDGKPGQAQLEKDVVFLYC